ncbi:hypothetical protein [Chitinimonas koreensis]|uniref:hypothetical protein n=1 Tax=Chitinimonas koreensis TaxID=356302 RepID=UPI0003F6FE3F|nr:hypothetical protein [Chitinimonas koreensis]QNM97783.1 hypothetical protein H9L41_05790 [Chitinimonas koreensis]
MTDPSSADWFDASTRPGAPAWLVGHAEAILRQEMAWAEQECAEGFAAYHPSAWWKQRLPEPWVTPIGFEYSVATWLLQYGLIADDDHGYRLEAGTDPAQRDAYRNVYAPGVDLLGAAPWLCFDGAADRYARALMAQSGETVSQHMALWQRAQRLALEKPWRTVPLAGFPPAAGFEGDDERAQFCADEQAFARQDFYLALFAAHAPGWNAAPARSSKQLLTYVRPIDANWQWAVLAWREREAKALDRLALVIVPAGGKRAVKPADTVFQYRFPFLQDLTLARQELALWQADLDFKHRCFERRMRWLEPLLMPYLDTLRPASDR